MADVVDKVSVPVEVQDKTGPGLAKATKSISKSATQMSGMVGEKAGRAMSQFNEKTEKGRQILTQFGGVMGGVAGETVYYAGTLSYIIGRFSLWELGIMAVVAAVGGLVWVLNQASDATVALEKHTAASRKEYKRLEEEINRVIEAERRQVLGLDAMAVAREKSHGKMVAAEFMLTASIEQAEAERAKGGNSARYRELMAVTRMREREWKTAVRLYEKIEKAEAEHLSRKMDAAIIAQDKEEAAKVKAKKRARATAAGRKDVYDEFGSGTMEAVGGGAALAEVEANKARLEREMAYLDQEVAAFDAAERRKIEIKQAAYDEQMAIADQVSGAMIGILDAMVSAEEGGAMRALGASLKALGLQNLWEGLTEAARGIGALFVPGLQAEAAGHFASAGKHAAIAAALGAAGGAIGGAAGGGGAAAVTAAALPQNQQGGRGEAKEQRSTYTFYVGTMAVGQGADRMFAEGAERHITSQTPGRADRKL